MDIPVSKIIPSPFQTRRVFDPKALEELAQTLKDHGLMNPINVRPKGDGYELIAGERRLRAAQLLGWETIEAKVEAIDDQEAAQRVLVENVQREDLGVIEQAIGYKTLAEPPFSLTQVEIAKRTGKDQGAISRYLAIAGIGGGHPEKYVPDIFLGFKHFLELIRLPDPQDQWDLANKASKDDLSVSQLKALVDARLGKSKPAKGSSRSQETAEAPPDPLADVWEQAESEETKSWEMTYKDFTWTLKLFAPEQRYRLYLKETLQKLADAIGDVEPERQAEQAFDKQMKAVIKPSGGLQPQVFEAMQQLQATLSPEEAKAYQRTIDEMKQAQEKMK